RADDSRDFVADRERHLPPTFGPSAHAARRPRVGVCLQALERRARHRAEAVRDHVGRLFEYWKLAPPLKKFVRQEPAPSPSRCASSISARKSKWLLRCAKGVV